MNTRILPYHEGEDIKKFRGLSCFALEYRLDSQMMNRLWEYISIARANEEEMDNRENLAGNISTELLLYDKDNIFFQQVVAPLISHFIPIVHLLLLQLQHTPLQTKCLVQDIQQKVRLLLV